ncbi:type III-A CRISPR-associated protein Csm2 [Niabella digestorum]|uniref:CRISPR system Cms protein Csm2 n=1 Tax=Niabella digestorum TaxID=3117701 RepID=A0ABU7RG07_9BACT
MPNHKVHNSYNNNKGSNHSSKKNDNNKKNNKTTEEIVNEVIETYFKDIKADLLSLNDVTKIKTIFSKLEQFVNETASGLSSSQLRNVYSKIIEAKTPIDLQLLRPNLAYVAARNEKLQAKQVMALIDHLIQQVDTEEKQKHFKKVMEAIVAYHKYSTTKEKNSNNEA